MTAMRSELISPQKSALTKAKIPQAMPVDSGWAVLPVDMATHNLILERRAEWADDLGATVVENAHAESVTNGVNIDEAVQNGNCLPDLPDLPDSHYHTPIPKQPKRPD
ncbi:hypothetical protein X797_012122 [Metarhizium robertsii]|uniref:Uncharacterized protein n=1 Tax=Metarhizium robertsii TaxID=568076 RepID=A0A014MUI9_9HYPO|nr:hypothetical protein X797_012122 [Metarhizium robertsii]